MAINSDWYGTNELRTYPLDDAATGVDDAGNALPPGILVDCSLRFPDELGRTAFISAVTVTPTLVTIAIEAASAVLSPSLLDSTPAPLPFTPLGTVSMPAPFTSFAAIPIEPAQDGVGGWLVLGQNLVTPYQGRFSTPGQSGLLPRCAQGYASLPITSLGRYGGTTALSGTVTLVPGTDMGIRLDYVTYESNLTLVIQFLLQGTLGTDPLETYIGACGARPESGTCVPAPIQQINGVTPDASGNIQLNFQHALTYPLVGNTGGLIVDVPTSLAMLCPPTSATADNDAAALGLPSTASDDACGDHIYFSASPPPLTVIAGVFASSTTGYEAVVGGSPVNAAVKARSPVPTLIRAVFLLPVARFFLPCNGGIVFGYTVDDSSVAHYYMVVFDVSGNQLVVYHNDGGVLTTTATFPFNRVTQSSLGNRLSQAVVELRVSFGEPAADAMLSVPTDKKIRVTIELDSALAIGHAALDVPDNAGEYGVCALQSDTYFKQLHAEDSASAS